MSAVSTRYQIGSRRRGPVASRLQSVRLRYGCRLIHAGDYQAPSPRTTTARPKHPQTTETPSGRSAELNRLEAVLFLAQEPLHARKLAKYANLADGTAARTLVGRLNELYDRSGRAFRVQEVAGGWQLRTRKKFANWLRRLPHVPAEVRLSAPSLETLAVVAYRQPVIRADIEAVRGVSCGEILRQLMEKDLVRVSGRSEDLGRPYFYSTTRRFLEVFGLSNLDELPRAEVFRQRELIASPIPQSIENGAECDQLPTLAVSPCASSPCASSAMQPAFQPLAEDDDEWEEVGDDEEDDDDYEYEYDDDDDDEEGDEEGDDEEVEEDDDAEEVEGDDWDDDDDEGEGEWEEVGDDEEIDDDYDYEYEDDEDDEDEDDEDEDDEDEDDEADDEDEWEEVEEDDVEDELEDDIDDDEDDEEEDDDFDDEDWEEEEEEDWVE